MEKPSRLRLRSQALAPPRKRLWKQVLAGASVAARGLGRAPRILPIHALGQRGEDLAYWSLREHGYTIVARNYRGRVGRGAGPAAPEGELDLIAYEGSPPTLVFIEVKTREREGEFDAAGAVDAVKRQHLARMARSYRRRRQLNGPYRFDVVVIYGPDDAQPRMQLYRDAFRA